MGKFLKKFTKITLALLMCFGVMDFTAFKPVEVRAEDEPTTSITASKDITDEDGDGVYELSLNIKGSAESSSHTEVDKANVVIVVDVSGSMSRTTYSPYTYSADTYSDSNSYYRRNNNGEYREVYYYNGNWHRSDNNNVYNGQVYLGQTRLEATQAALNKLVDTLLANNKNETTPDGTDLSNVIEISLVKFAYANDAWGYSGNDYVHFNGTELLVQGQKTAGDTTTEGTLRYAIDNLWAGGGTNWERALAVADAEADRYKAAQPNEAVSVIFMTDGVPTSWGTTNTQGSETSNNTHTAWNEADDDARTIVTDGYTLYNIFAYGTDTTKYDNDGNRTDADYLRSLTNYAYSGTGTYANTSLNNTTRNYFFNASNTAALEEAFKKIANSISNNVGYAGVYVDDGVTTGVTSTSVTVDGTVDASKFHYEVKDEAGNVVYTTSFNSDGTAAKFKINGTEHDATISNVSLDIDGDGESETYKVATVTVGDKTYKMSPATMDANGKIEWKLAGIGILENGYTYTLSFDVWPNQFSYDLVADLNNGVKTKEQIRAEIIREKGEAVWNQINAALVGPDANGKYSIRTNYEQFVDYYVADETVNETTGETETTYTPQPRKELGPKDPVALTSSEMRMLKLWDDSLDEDQLKELLWKDYTSENPSDPTKYGVTLRVWKADTLASLNSLVEAGTAGTEYLTKTLGWSETEEKYVWESKLDVAPGTMINITKAQEMGFDTDDFNKVTYNGTTYIILESGHYYYVTEDNIDRHFELNTIVYHPMLVDGVLSNVKFNENGTVEEIVALSRVEATNTLKGGINVIKQAFDGDAEILATDDTFTVEITMKNSDGTPYEDWDYRIYYGANNPAGVWDEEFQNYGRSGHNYGTTGNGGIITAELYIGDVIRVINVPAGVTYKVKETKVNDTALNDEGYADNYKYTETTYEISRGAADEFVADVANADGTYTVHGNSASQATISNKVPSAVVSVLKTGKVDNKTGLAGVKFKLYYDEAATKQVVKDSLGKDIGDKDNENILTSGSDGKIALGTFIPGTYYLKEVETVDGYKLNNTLVAITVNSDGTVANATDGTVTVTNEEVVNVTANKVWRGTPTDSVKVQLKANGTASGAEVTLNAANSWTYTWSNLDKYDAQGTAIEYTVEETSPTSGYEISVTHNTDAKGNVTATIVNTELGDITVTKIWSDSSNAEGFRPTSVTFKLYKTVNGKTTAVTGEKATVELSGSGDNWTATISDLPKYEGENPITYSVKELDGTTEVADGATAFNGKYTASYSEDQLTVTNSREVKKTSIVANKTWNDANNQDGKRPTTATVQLYKNSTAYGDPVTVPATDGQITVWDNLPVYENGQAVVYKVVETLPNNTYTKGGDDTDITATENAVSGTVNITNSYTPKTINLKATKAWSDNDDQDGKRVSQNTGATIQLYKTVDGVESAVTTDGTGNVPMTDGDIRSWTDLPVYENGKPITYSIKETLPTGSEYTPTYSDPITASEEMTGTQVLTVTNSYSPEKTKVTVVKVWADDNDNDGKRASVGATVQLYKLVGTTSTAVGAPVNVGTADNWSNPWTDLPVYEDGTQIKYYVVETLPENSGYTKAGDGEATLVLAKAGDSGSITVTNTHENITTSIAVTKTWVDNDDQDGIRKNLGATVTLYRQVAGGEKTAVYTGVAVPAVDADGNIIPDNTATAVVTWDKLPVYEDGKKITYTVEETLPNTSYTKAGDNAPIEAKEETLSGTAAITNTHTPEKTTVTVKKVWVDANDQDGKRSSVNAKVKLYADGTEVTGSEQNVGTGDNWSYTWNNLDKYKEGGKPISYSVQETKADETYSTEITAAVSSTAETREITVTNKYTPETTSVKVTKTWDDASDQDGKRSGVVATVQLYKQVGEGAPVPVEGKSAAVPTGNTSNNVDVTLFEGLPVYENKQKITYSVVETLTTPNGYEYVDTAADDPKVAVNGETLTFDITNKHTPATTERSVKKVWEDNNNQDGKRPTSLTVTLMDGNNPYKDSEGNTVTRELNAANGWSATVTGLPVNKDHGTEIQYSWTEGTLPDGYELVSTQPDETDKTLIILTNEYEPEATTISVAKTWVDADDQDGKRSGVSAVIELYKTVNVAVTDEDGNPVMDETGAPTYEEKTEKIKEVTVTYAGGDLATWNLPVYENGQKITYKVKEVLTTANGYESDTVELTTVTNGGKHTVTNTYEPETTTITVTKKWNDADDQDGKRSGVVATVTLYKTVGETTTEVETVAVPYTDGTVKAWADLPVYEKVGQPITYSVKETLSTPNEYTTDTAEAVTVENGGSKEINNNYTPETTKLTVTKKWDDANNQDGKRPTTATVQLYKQVGDGQKVAVGEPVTVPATDGTVKVFENLPVYEGGKKITYSVEETLPQGTEYTKSGDDVTKLAVKNDSGTIEITNSYTPKVVEVSVVKVWADRENQDGFRPTKVNLVLKADGTTIKTFELDQSNQWTDSVRNLPQYKAGKEIVYTFEELTISEYTTEIDDPEVTDVKVDELVTGKHYAFTVTNTHEPYKTKVTVEKTWDDKDDQDGIRKDVGATVQLYKQPEGGRKESVGDPVAVETTDNWSKVWEELPVYEGGKKITYIVEETLPDGSKYTRTYNGAYSLEAIKGTQENLVTDSGTVKITNSYTPEETEATVIKVWDDEEDLYGLRPEALKVTLKADGETAKDAEGKDIVVTLNEGNTWKAKVEGLPKNKKGTAIVYSWEEDAVGGYELSGTTAEATVTTLTNKLKRVDLIIEKEINKYVDAGENLTFVFKGTVKRNGSAVYEYTVGIELDKYSTNGTAEIKNIPFDPETDEITVEEIYSAGYKLDGEVTLTSNEDKTKWTAKAKNIYEEIIPGSGAVNKYSNKTHEKNQTRESEG